MARAWSYRRAVSPGLFLARGGSVQSWEKKRREADERQEDSLEVPPQVQRQAGAGTCSPARPED